LPSELRNEDAETISDFLSIMSLEQDLAEVASLG
jgi:hypothetical protein